MQRNIALRLRIVLFASSLGIFALAAVAAPQAIKTIETKGVAKKCLPCHGDYDKLAEKTSGYKTPSGETATPHQYVPHAEKTEIPDCTECHEAHPIPLEDKSKAVIPKQIDWCYGTCHHAGNLQACQGCH